jgi:hypothetical protein
MRNPTGYSIVTAPGERVVEHDTFTCAHCRQITFTKGGLTSPLQVAIIKADGSVQMRDVAKCFRCDEYVCPRCEGGECYPGMKRIEEEEKLARIILGLS